MLSVAGDLARIVATGSGVDLRAAGDPDEVRRIVENLLDNAFRYGGDGVPVWIATQATERE